MPDRDLYVLDTNTCSYVIKGTYPRLRQRLRRLPLSRVCISVITQAELLFGLARRPEATALREAVFSFFEHLSIRTWESGAARCYAHIRADLERRGLPMGNMDMFIAAHAVALDAVLVTNDAVFKNVDHLRREDWTRARR